MDRTGIITFKGNAFTLSGNPVKAGDNAPDFRLLANDLSPRSLADYKGKVCVFSVVPSLDTGVCDLQTRRFNSEAAALGEKVRILTVSCDLPFAQARWCGMAGATQLETLSDHYELSFGLAYGLVIKELRLLTRAVLVVDAKGRISYCEIVPEVTDEVNFDAVLAAARAAL
ncbi:thiol peroxidase [Desulfovibrio sp. OttesenSCG-928-A18]|nr:thiol peroxidase [Desulfovibrio sp. OttesenSCG-928-A18]